MIKTKFVFNHLCFAMEGNFKQRLLHLNKNKGIHRQQTCYATQGGVLPCCSDLELLIRMLWSGPIPIVYPKRRELSGGDGDLFSLYSPEAILVFSMEWVFNKDLLNKWINQCSCYLFLHSHQGCSINRKIIGWKSYSASIENFQKYWYLLSI